MNEIAAGALYDAIEMTQETIRQTADLRDTAADRANSAHRKIEKLIRQRDCLLDGLQEMTGDREWSPE